MPSLILTIDTELSNFPGAQGLWGEWQGREYGVRFMLELFGRAGATGTFFGDVYGASESAVTAQRKACDLLAAAGQDVQLHTHPGPSFDCARPRLDQYSEEEQRQILAFGCGRLREWVGVTATVHRAGDWAGNAATLAALAAAGLAADFSACAWSRACTAPPAVLAGNGWCRYDGLLCCPATCYRDGLTRRLRRVDLHTCSRAELWGLFERQVDPLILVLHSFSFFLAHSRGSWVDDGDDGSARFLRFCAEARGRYGYRIEAAAEAVARLTAAPASGLRLTPFPATGLLASGAGNLHRLISGRWRRRLRRRHTEGAA